MGSAPPGAETSAERPGNDDEASELPALFTFDTTHHALWAEEVAAESDIPAEIVPAPAAAAARCNLALATLPRDELRMRDALARAGVPHGTYPAE